MEERILYKNFKQLIEEMPEIKGEHPLEELITKVCDHYDIELHSFHEVFNPITAVQMGKGKYFNGKHEGKEGLFLAFIGAEFNGSSIQVIYNPQT